MQKLKNKVAVIYGDGNIGAASAKAFAIEGAKVFLTGRTSDKLKKIADETKSNGGCVEIAQVGALNEVAVEKHLNDVIEKVGRVDISFNAIGLPQKEIQGTPFMELSVERFSLPIVTYSQSQFITSKAAARQMMKQCNGVILMHTPNASRLSPPFVGGMVPAWSAIEAWSRSLSVECGDKGVRSVCLLTTGIPETSRLCFI